MPDRLGNRKTAWVALNLALPGCPRVAWNLLARFGSPGAILGAAPEELAEIPGVTVRIVNRLKNNELLAAAGSEIERATRRSVRILVRDDPEYPGILTHLPDPPLLLYMRGTCRAEDDPAVAIVGSRRATPYGIEMASSLASEIAAAGVTVISGLARGIDEAAHRGSLEAGGRTMALLGSGIDRIYPPENRNLANRISLNGAVLSEFPLGTPPLKGNFPVRNRLISGFSRATLVVEAGARSGSLITARLALEQGRDVLAVPGNATTPNAAGPLFLIQQGAKLVMRGQDALEEIPGLARPAPVASPAPSSETAELDAEALQILSGLEIDEGMTLDSLVERTRVDAGVLLGRLLEFELAGRVRQLPGGQFIRRKGKTPLG